MGLSVFPSIDQLPVPVVSQFAEVFQPKSYGGGLTPARSCCCCDWRQLFAEDSSCHQGGRHWHPQLSGIGGDVELACVDGAPRSLLSERLTNAITRA